MPLQSSALCLLLALASGPLSAQTTFTVTTTADEGDGSLRQALLDANANAGADVIAFDLSGEGPHTIDPASALPAVTDPVLIDGLSQPGASCDAWPATLKVVLDGVRLKIETDDATVQGLVFPEGGIDIRGSRNAVECNYIGTDVTGTVRRAGFQWISLGRFINGVEVACTDNRVGGPGPGQRNVLGGSVFIGLEVGCDGTVIQGNYIGVDVSGQVTIGSQGTAISISADDVLLGGPSPGEGNVITGNDFLGSSGSVSVTGDAERLRIQGNYFGTDPEGNPPTGTIRPGLFAIRIDVPSTRVSGDPQILIGGTEPGAGNTIANHVLWGVRAEGQINTGRPAPAVAILGNRIFDNGKPFGDGSGGPQGVGEDFAIDVGVRGAGAGGSDNRQFPNAPELDRLPTLTTATAARVRGTLTDRPSQRYWIEVFADDGGCTAFRLADARYYLGAFEVRTNASGTATFDERLTTSGVPEGAVVGVTATTIVGGSAENGRTSELSACEAFPTDPLLVDRSGDLVDFDIGSGAFFSVLPGSLRWAIDYANANPGPDVIRFDIPLDQPGCDPSTGVCTLTSRDGINGIALTDRVTIDGTTQPGAGCGPGQTPRIVYSGEGARRGFWFEEGSGGSALRGLALNAFPNTAVVVYEGPFTLTCSFVGTDATGTQRVGNGTGLEILASDVTIGGTAPGDGVLVSGNGTGIRVGYSFPRVSGVRVLGSQLGTDATGTQPLGNGTAIRINSAVDVEIGGPTSEAGNVIAHNSTAGVRLSDYTDDADDPVRVSVLGNDLFANGGGETPPIVFGSTFGGPPANDPGDADEGPNRGMNAPVVTSAQAFPGGQVIVTYAVDADPANATYPLRVEFFEGEAGATYPGGVRFLGFDRVPRAQAGGERTVTLTPRDPVPEGTVVVATATDGDGNTSPFTATATTVPAEDGPALPAVFALTPAYPNPAAATATLALDLPASGPVTVEAFDALGRRVAVLADGEHPAGVHALAFDVQALPAGVYLVRARSGDAEAVRRVTVLR